jgi:hypothetical protein
LGDCNISAEAYYLLHALCIFTTLQTPLEELELIVKEPIIAENALKLIEYIESQKYIFLQSDAHILYGSNMNMKKIYMFTDVNIKINMHWLKHIFILLYDVILSKPESM